MTTTVTVKTHDWPVKAVITDKYRPNDRGYSVSVTTEDVAPNSERQFYLTDTRSIAFHECARPEKPE